MNPVDDPAEHFPYKKKDAMAAVDADNRFGNATTVNAASAYVSAQAAYLSGTGSRDNYNKAAAALVAARVAHRARRSGVGIIADGGQ